MKIISERLVIIVRERQCGVVRDVDNFDSFQSCFTPALYSYRRLPVNFLPRPTFFSSRPSLETKKERKIKLELKA